jgi:hypothetical protein
VLNFLLASTLPAAEALARLRVAPRGVQKIAAFLGDFLKSRFDFAQSSGI